MNRQQFIDSACRALELTELTPDDLGVYAIVFDGDLEVEIAPLNESRVLLRSRLATLPDDPAEQEEFFRKQLQRNMTNLHSQRGAVTIDRASGQLWLYRQVDVAGLSDDRMVSAVVEDFVNLAEWWGQADSASAPATTGLPFTMLRP